MSCESLGDARLKFKEFEDTVKNFYQAYTKYHDAINDEYDITDSQEYLATEQMRIDNFSRTLEEWMRSLESQTINQAQINEVRPIDSASNVEVSSRKDSRLSKVSRISSSLSARLAIRAKRAALEAEKFELAAQQALEKERLQLEQRTRELQLRTELAKAEAEERIYSQAMDVNPLNPHTYHDKRDQDCTSERNFRLKLIHPTWLLGDQFPINQRAV